MRFTPKCFDEHKDCKAHRTCSLKCLCLYSVYVYEYDLGLKQPCIGNAFKKKAAFTLILLYSLFYFTGAFSWIDYFAPLDIKQSNDKIHISQFNIKTWFDCVSLECSQCKPGTSSPVSRLVCADFFPISLRTNTSLRVLQNTWMLLWGFVCFILHILVHSLVKVTRCIHSARSVAGNHYSFQSAFSIRHTPVVTLRRLVGTMWHAGFRMILRAILTHSKWISYTLADT